MSDFKNRCICYNADLTARIELAIKPSLDRTIRCCELPNAVALDICPVYKPALMLAFRRLLLSQNAGDLQAEIENSQMLVTAVHQPLVCF